MTVFLGFEPGEISRGVFDPILREHASEAAFLWQRRAVAVRSPRYTLKDLAELDNRVDAHVDGLRVAGEQAWQACEEFLSTGAGEVFAATAFALRASPEQEDARLDVILGEVAPRPEMLAGMLSALGFSPWPRVEKHAHSWLTSEDSFLQALGLAAFRLHRRAPPEAALRQAMAAGTPRVRQEALRIAGELKLPLPELALARPPGSPDFLRLAWARSLLLLQHTGPAMPVLRTLAEQGGPESGQATELLARRMEKQTALEWLHAQLRGTDRRRALLAVGAAGYPDLVETLVDWMEDDTLARLAGFAFSLVTGVDLALLDLEREPPAPPDEETEDVVDDPDEALPWPHGALIRGWWSQNAKDYRPGQRYLMGKPIQRADLPHVLASGKQPHRRAAALELALLDAKTPLAATSKPGWEQARELLGWP